MSEGGQAAAQAQPVPAGPREISADRPLTRPEEDRLGYAPFARHLAKALCERRDHAGLVVALYGSWGSGKSTVLNFVLHYLREEFKSDCPTVVQFNPWWFSGQERLTRAFFDTLHSALAGRSTSSKRLTRQLARLGDMVSQTQAPFGWAPALLVRLLRRQPEDLHELKAEIEKALKRRKRKILVVIDDVDRLAAGEIRELFTLIRTVADFPNVTYLLAFDKAVAIAALKAVQELSGARELSGVHYLEKIVQVPFELPVPDRVCLGRMLFEKLDQILVGTTVTVDEHYWANLYRKGIEHFITSPRTVVRLTNALRVTYAAVRNEVNPVDFIATEALRLCCSPVYEQIRRSPEYFVDTRDRDWLCGLRDGDLESFHGAWLDQMEPADREPIRNILRRMFPKLESVWGGGTYGSDFARRWRNELRICSRERFPVYFRLSVAEGEVSSAEVRQLTALAGDPQALGGKLLELASQHRPDGRTRVCEALERLADRSQEVAAEHIPVVLRTLFAVGDDLLRPEDGRRALLEFDSLARLGWVIWPLLERVGEQDRFPVLAKAMRESSALATLEDKFVVLAKQHGGYGATPEAKPLVSREQLDELKEIVAQKVRTAAATGALLRAKCLPSILHRWCDWDGESAVRQWVQCAVESDQGLAVFLEQFQGEHFIQGDNENVARRVRRLDQRSLQRFIDPATLIERCRGLAQNASLTPAQRQAASLFVRESELLQQGKDPMWGMEQ